jgi:hypothetical protein
MPPTVLPTVTPTDKPSTLSPSTAGAQCTAAAAPHALVPAQRVAFRMGTVSAGGWRVCACVRLRRQAA